MQAMMNEEKALWLTIAFFIILFVIGALSIVPPRVSCEKQCSKACEYIFDWGERAGCYGDCFEERCLGSGPHPSYFW